jgi:CzcA family heavy metal efflux pump
MSDAKTESESSSFIVRQSKAILFVTVCFCLAGVISAWSMPSSVFPQTNFPRVVILIDNGVMPADEMMATITRPVEEVMKDIPGAVSVRSATQRGSAEVSVYFDWSVDMIQSEMYVHSRIGQIRASLPATATVNVYRLTFSSFPIIGVSLTSTGGRSQASLWEIARYDIKPRLLRIPGVARVDLLGGRVPEYHVVVDPLKLEGYQLSLGEVSDALRRGNLIGAAGLHDEAHQLYLTVVDARGKTAADIAELVVAQTESGPVRVKDFATVRPGEEPQFTLVSAENRRAVLLGIRSQPEGSTLDISAGVQQELDRLRRELPPDTHLAFYYDQSILVRESVWGVWESIGLGLILSTVVLFGFLKSGQTWGTTAMTTVVAVVVIPIAVLVTLVVMKLLGMSFNLMTLGGIAAAIGIVIDDAIVVVDSISAHLVAGKTTAEAVRLAAQETTKPLITSTLTPVVVFIPLAFIDGIQGVFFRALAIAMTVALLTSLVLAVLLTPSLATRLIKVSVGAPKPGSDIQGGPITRLLVRLYEWVARRALRHAGLTFALSLLVLAGTAALYFQLKQDFLPEMDEGAFVLDYRMPPGTALSETDRVIKHVEQMLRDTPEVESYSRRTGARNALALAEPHFGDILVKLKKERKRGIEEIKDDLRQRIEGGEPALHISMAGILGDLIADLMWAPAPIEVRVYSTDPQVLKKRARQIAELIEDKDGKGVHGVVDVNDGIYFAGSALTYRLRKEDLLRYGLTGDDVARTLNIALLGETPSYVLEGDRRVNIRVVADPRQVADSTAIDALLVRSSNGAGSRLSAVADRRVETGQLQLRRENQRQYVAVGARTSGRDLGGAVQDIQKALDREMPDRSDCRIEFGGLYEEQQRSFFNLLLVLCSAVVLVFLVLLVEFRSLLAPLAIVWGALLSLFGVGLALWLSDVSLNIISFLGAIMGIGIVAKNGILMLDYVEHLRGEGLPLADALIQSGRRRLRPVLMTSLTTALGMVPLAYGVGSGADMLKPLAIAVMGALAISVLLALVATPVVYFLLMRFFGAVAGIEATISTSVSAPSGNGQPVDTPVKQPV